MRPFRLARLWEGRRQPANMSPPPGRLRPFSSTRTGECATLTGSSQPMLHRAEYVRG
jgi:hypothetical protein